MLSIASALLLASSLTVTPTLRTAPKARPEAVVKAGKARFTVLTPRLLRLEWSKNGAFEDRASLFALRRRLPLPAFRTWREGGWFHLSTKALHLRYKPGSGAFDGNNLEIALHTGGIRTVWRPGMEDKGNLGGTVRTLDGVNGAIPLKKGVLSRDGWYLRDDSKTPLFTEKPDPLMGAPWVRARPGGEYQDWYFFGAGRDYKAALRDYTALCGPIPLPPLFSLGAWWSRYWSYTSEQFKDLVRQFKEHGVPLDVLVIDMGWHLKGWTGYTWDPKYFPHPAHFLAWVHKQGLKVTLNVHPHQGVGNHEKAWKAFAKAMGKDPEKEKRIPLDVADPRYMRAYFDLLHHPLEKEGVDFWWIDWQQGKKSGITGLDPLFMFNHLHFLDAGRNPAKRPLILSRWAEPCGHRYVLQFSGDTWSTWASLDFQPYFTATAGNIGASWWSHDIGGHMPGPVDPEIYARWVQLGALSPVLRTHTTQNPKAERRIWAYPEPYYGAMKKAFLLRYALIPYIYTMGRRCYDRSIPLCRPLYLEHPFTEEAYLHPDEYYFGDDLLAAPPVTPREKATDRTVVDIWVPPGEWEDWFTGERFKGPGQVRLFVPLDRVPLLARAGTVIPTSPGVTRTSRIAASPLVLEVFPGAEGGMDLYEDDGISQAYLSGDYAFLPLRQKSGRGGSTTLTVGPRKGSFRGMRKTRDLEIRLRGVLAERVEADGVPLPLAKDAEGPCYFLEENPRRTVVRLPALDLSKKHSFLLAPKDPEQDALVQRVKSLAGRLFDAAAWTGEPGLVKNAAAVNQTLGLLEKATPAETRKMAALLEEVLATSAQLLSLQQPADPTARKARDRALERLSGVGVELALVTESGRPGILARARGFSRDEGGDSPCALELTFLGGKARGKVQARSGSVAGCEASLAVDTSPPLSPSILEGTIHVRWKGVDLAFRREIRLCRWISDWRLAGPFKGKFDQAFPPENGPVRLEDRWKTASGKTFGWIPLHRTVTAPSDLTTPFRVKLWRKFGWGGKNQVAYAATWIEVDKDCDAIFHFGSDDQGAIRLDGKWIHRYPRTRAWVLDQDAVPARLTKGRHEILVKVGQKGGYWEFSLRVEPTAPKNVRIRVLDRP